MVNNCDEDSGAARDGRPTALIFPVGRASVPASIRFSYFVVAFRS